MSSNKYGEYYMTLCLSGLYDSGKRAVVLADKMMTYKFHGEAEDFSVEREEVTKVFKVNATTAILVSGNRSFGLELIEKVEKRLKRTHDIDKVRDIVAKVYDSLNEKHAFHETLCPIFSSLKQYR